MEDVWLSGPPVEQVKSSLRQTECHLSQYPRQVTAADFFLRELQFFLNVLMQLYI
jgi:hypothetical protein